LIDDVDCNLYYFFVFKITLYSFEIINHPLCYGGVEMAFNTTNGSFLQSVLLIFDTGFKN